MTDQQNKNLHPYVTPFSHLLGQTITSTEWCNPIVYRNVIYILSTIATNNNTTTINIKAFPGQPGQDPLESNIDNINGVETNPILQLDIKDGGQDAALYLLFKSNNLYNLRAYDLNLNVAFGWPLWNENVITGALEGTNMGMVFNHSQLPAQIPIPNIFVYELIGQKLRIHVHNKLTGAWILTKEVMIEKESVYCYLFMNNFDNCYVITSNDTQLCMACFNINLDPLVLTPNIPISLTNDNATVSAPAVMRFQKDNNKNMCSIIYGYNNDVTNCLQCVYIPNITDTDSTPAGNIIGLDIPFFYKLNKYDLFGEISQSGQRNMNVCLTTNPNNTNFVYFAYVAGTNQIRVVKLYRCNSTINIYEKYVPIVMWATRLDAIDLSFEENLGITTDTTGGIFVTLRRTTGEIRMWYIREFIMDLGYTEGTVVAPVDTIPNLLADMANSIGANNVYITSIIQNQNPPSLDITFTYTGAALQQQDVDNMKTLVKNAFVTLYEDSGINIIDAQSAQVGVGLSTLVISFPTGTEKKPCILKGTEIIKMDGDIPQRVPVERIKIGDYVLNHLGKSVQVLEHLVTTIYTQSHNAPYMIPKDFFGDNRPYKDLFISGDHAILVNYASKRNMRVVYASDITILKQYFVNEMVEVEYHHLLLENHQDNFFIANGLEVDSYHPGIIMRH